jgi:soluble lytic murein transglycosylase
LGLIPPVLAPATPARAEVSAGETAAARQALKAADDGKLDEARRLAKRVGDPLLTKLISWIDLARPDSGADFQTIAQFLRDNPGWPNQAAIRRNAEDAMPPLAPVDVIAWFDANPPLTSGGFARYVEALLATDQSERALILVRHRYTDTNLGQGEERDFRRKFAELLRPEDDLARLDRLLWDEDVVDARRVMMLVDPDHQALAEARIALQTQAGNADSAVNKVPARLSQDPGLLYERARWRRRKDMDDEALAILEKPPKDLVRPAAWWTERHILARALIERGDYARAYKLVVDHGVPDGVAFTQAEFLAGFICLKFLNNADQALKHFEILYRNVKTPVSLTRGAYWAGRAAKALGDPDRAHYWFDAAAVHGTTFYGQLAAAELHLPANSGIAAEPPLPAEALAAFNKRDTVRAVRLLRRIEPDPGRHADQFLRRLVADAREVEEFHMIGRLAAEANRRELGVALAKEAQQDGVTLLELGWPLLDSKLAPRPEPALVHALIRQESTFNKDAVSTAGARGLMQLMPTTAQHVAKRIGIKKMNVKSLNDASRNLQLGTAYVQDLLDRFGGSYVLAVAAYNGGPGRVASWVRQYGDPRTDATDVVDWIELIPVYETRNYVQRVIENLQVYRYRMHTPAVSIAEDLKR